MNDSGKTDHTTNKIQEIMASLNEQTPIPIDQIKKTILILSTPRCGSTMFCDILRKSGNFGYPGEWFNERYMEAYSTLKNTTKLDFADYVEFIISHTATANGVFSVNTHIDQYLFLRKQNVDILQIGFDHIFYLYRKDKIAQAVSFTIAKHTDQWSANDGPASFNEADIKNSAITSWLLHMINSDEFYQNNLKQYCAAEFYYEDFSKPDTTDAFSTITSLTGIEYGSLDQKPSTKIQRNDTTRSIINRYKHYIGM